MATYDVIVIGAGLAGLACARALKQSGARILVCEASDAPGGKLRTDAVNGFLLDRGFQVFSSAYPEAQRTLDYGALDLKSFRVGARLFSGKGFHTVADPLREPGAILSTLTSGTGSLFDSLRVLNFRRRVTTGKTSELFERPESTALQYLRARGFSNRIVSNFFEPFFGGVFLDRSLGASSRMLEFCTRMFVTGEACLPAGGMGAIPQQLAAELGARVVRYHARAQCIERGTVTLEGGEQLQAPYIVLAVDGVSAHALAEGAGITASEPPQKYQGVFAVYFSAPASTELGRWIHLNSSGRGIIQSVSVLSNVQSTYAPSGRSLVSVTVLPDKVSDRAALESIALEELMQWFGESVRAWEHLRTYYIPAALPARPSVSEQTTESAWLGEDRWLLRCGDYLDTPSINGALRSGRIAAEELCRALG
jgi:phytoene dehydrogenase-like protein